MISFGVMFTLTSYLVMLTLKLNRKRVVRRCRVSSCIWTRRKVFWLQKGKTRSAYLLDAQENSIKTHAYCGKEACERTEKFSCISCCNILKLSILTPIAALACTKAQIFNDLQRHKTNTQCMSNFTLRSRSFDKMNDNIGYVPRLYKEYDFRYSPDEVGNPQWQLTGPRYSPDIIEDCSLHRDQAMLIKPTVHTSMPFELGIGPEYSSDIAGDGPRKRTFDGDDYNPELERVKKKRIHNSKRSKTVRKAENAKRSQAVRKAENAKRSQTVIKTYNDKRSKTVIKAENAKTSQAIIKAYNDKRSKTDRKAENQTRPKKSSKSGKEYDTSSPFPPTAEQLRFTGRILENSVAALFAQQSPSPEISYAAVVAEQLRSYTQPIIDFTLNQFKQECCDMLFGDLNYAKAAANKALNNLEKILLLNNHYQLMWDFSVWDIYNPPSLSELKLLSKRHPYQPISELLREEVDSFKKIIHSQIESILQYRQIKTESNEDSQNEDSCRRYCYPPSEKYF